MDIIVRKLVKERENGFKQVFDFTTYSTIFTPAEWPEDPKAKAVLRMLQNQFILGLKGFKNSPSKMPQVIVKTEKIHSPLCTMAKESGYRGNGNKQHSIVQNHALANPNCLAVEVPVHYKDIEGCIDGMDMFLNPFKLVLWDFKPDAHKEKQAATQLIHYERGVLNLTAGILKQDDIELVFFDDTNAYKVIR